MCVGTEGHKGVQGEPGEGFLVLSLVTGTRNRLNSLGRLIKSILDYTTLSYELIIADASDEPITVYSPAGSNVKILPEHPRLGVSRGYNRAFAMAAGKYVIWLNDDAEVLPGYDVAAVQFMERHPQIGLGALYYKEGQQDFHVNAYLGMTYANFGIMNREFGNSIGWFDEEFPMYGSDNALAFKVLLADKGVAGIRDAQLIHHAVNDIHRQENNQSSDRWRDVESLMQKYGQHVRYMRGIYHSTRVMAALEGKDHTPESISRRFA
jgi:GT2 family glycosyltransferase